MQERPKVFHYISAMQDEHNRLAAQLQMVDVEILKYTQASQKASALAASQNSTISSKATSILQASLQKLAELELQQTSLRAQITDPAFFSQENINADSQFLSTLSGEGEWKRISTHLRKLWSDVAEVQAALQLDQQEVEALAAVQPGSESPSRFAQSSAPQQYQQQYEEYTPPPRESEALESEAASSSAQSEKSKKDRRTFAKWGALALLIIAGVVSGIAAAIILSDLALLLAGAGILAVMAGVGTYILSDGVIPYEKIKEGALTFAKWSATVLLIIAAAVSAVTAAVILYLGGTGVLILPGLAILAPIAVVGAAILTAGAAGRSPFWGGLGVVLLVGAAIGALAVAGVAATATPYFAAGLVVVGAFAAIPLLALVVAALAQKNIPRTEALDNDKPAAGEDPAANKPSAELGLSIYGPTSLLAPGPSASTEAGELSGARDSQPIAASNEGASLGFGSFPVYGSDGSLVSGFSALSSPRREKASGKAGELGVARDSQPIAAGNEGALPTFGSFPVYDQNGWVSTGTGEPKHHLAQEGQSYGNK